MVGALFWFYTAIDGFGGGYGVSLQAKDGLNSDDILSSDYGSDSYSYSAFVEPNGVAVRPSLFTRLGTAVSCHPMRTYSGAET